MRYRRLLERLRRQNWTAVGIDLVIVVVGVFIGIQVANWNADRIERAKQTRVIDAFRTDIRDYSAVFRRFSDGANKGLADFDAARARGEKPAPYFMRYRGSETAPASVWQVAQQSGLADLVHPGLMFEIGYYYSEIDGIGVRFVRYSEFVEAEILPYTDDPAVFYDEAGNLKPRYRQNMQRLREYLADTAATIVSAECLLKRFEAPRDAGPSCRTDYGGFNGKAPSP